MNSNFTEPDSTLQSCAWGRNSATQKLTRISAGEIASLKCADRNARTSATASCTVAFISMIAGFKSWLTSLFYVQSQRHTMCENYGHVADPRQWSEHLPSCSDCGARITTRNQLRKAVPNR